MTTSVIGSNTDNTTEVPSASIDSLAAGRYSLILSTDRIHRYAAQKLRYEVFGAEPGFILPDNADGIDSDRFDSFCDHLLVREDLTGEFVGCYRLLPPAAAAQAGGYYTATEFDISALDPVHSRVVEMGRAAVRPDHRSGSVLGLMWAGILHYLERTGHDAMMGCVSVPMASPPLPAAGIGVPVEAEPEGANVRAVRDLLLRKHASPAEQRVVPRNPVTVNGVPLDDIAPAVRTNVPPLLRGYLRLGAVICGEPAHDPDFGVADFVAILALRKANTRYLDRLRSAAGAAESGAPV